MCPSLSRALPMQSFLCRANCAMSFASKSTRNLWDTCWCVAAVAGVRGPEQTGTCATCPRMSHLSCILLPPQGPQRVNQNSAQHGGAAALNAAQDVKVDFHKHFHVAPSLFSRHFCMFTPRNQHRAAAAPMPAASRPLAEHLTAAATPQSRNCKCMRDAQHRYNQLPPAAAPCEGRERRGSSSWEMGVGLGQRGGRESQ